ncbi:MAG TPA: hypothetical protein VF152_12410 [Acidimicrobiia bacterium]
MTTTTENLTTGWEPETPVEDSLLRRYLFCWAHQCEAFATSAGGRAVQGPAFAAADFGRPSGWFNSATLLAPLEPATADGVLDEVEAFFAGGTGEALLWSAWPTGDLQRRGWHLIGHPPLLVRPPARLVGVPEAPDVRVTEVDDPAGLVDWERVAVEGYPLPELQPFRAGSLVDERILADARLRLTLGWDDGEPVSLGALFADSGIACFALGVTQPTARGRGHWRAHAVHRLNTAPDVWVTGVFSDYSRSPAQRIGFVPILRFTLWARPRNEDRAQRSTP